MGCSRAGSGRDFETFHVKFARAGAAPHRSQPHAQMPRHEGVLTGPTAPYSGSWVSFGLFLELEKTTHPNHPPAPPPSAFLHQNRWHLISANVVNHQPLELPHSQRGAHTLYEQVGRGGAGGGYVCLFQL